MKANCKLTLKKTGKNYTEDGEEATANLAAAEEQQLGLAHPSSCSSVAA